GLTRREPERDELSAPPAQNEHRFRKPVPRRLDAIPHGSVCPGGPGDTTTEGPERPLRRSSFVPLDFGSAEAEDELRVVGHLLGRPGRLARELGVDGLDALPA